MKKLLSFLCGIFIFSVFLKSQGIYPEEVFLVREFTNHKAAMGENLSRIHMPYSSISGSPYLHDDFKEGEAISVDSIRYVNVKFRYNIFEDQIEYLMNDEILILANPQNFNYFFMGEDVLFYQAYSSKKNSPEKGYFLLLTTGQSATLAKKMNIVYEAPKNPQPYTAAKPAKFSRKEDTYYLKLPGKIPQPLRLDEKRVINSFPDRAKELNEFIDENKLNVKVEEDLIKLVRYYNSL